MDVMSPESYWLLLGAVTVLILLQGIIFFRQYQHQKAAQTQLATMNEMFVKHRRQIELEFAELNQFITNDTAELKRKAAQREEKVDQLRMSVLQQFQQIQRTTEKLSATQVENSEELRKLMIQVYSGLKMQQGQIERKLVEQSVAIEKSGMETREQLTNQLKSLRVVSVKPAVATPVSRPQAKPAAVATRTAAQPVKRVREAEPAL